MATISPDGFDINRLIDQPYASTTSYEDIFYCFRLILGRNPGATEWKWHESRKGGNLTQTVKSYLASLEFMKRNMLAQSSNLDDIEVANINGANLYARANDPIIGRNVLAGTYEPEVVKTFMGYVKPKMRVIDIGANIGFYTMLSATLVGREGHVLAVEPNKDNVRLLESSRRLNNFDNVTVAGVAAGTGIGVLALHAGESNGTTIAPTDKDDVLHAVELVPCINVDALLSDSEKVDFVKVDVEGAEFLALSGMRRAIVRERPIIVSEFSPESLPVFSRCTSNDYLAFIIDMGYTIGIIDKQGGVSRCGRDAQKVMQVFRAQDSDHVDLLCEPRTGRK